MRAAIYARYSTELQREASIEDQRRICRRLIDENNWTEIKLYADQGVSGSSHLRPGYQTMVTDAQNGVFDVLVAESIDRLSRDQEHIAALYEQMRYLGIPIVTIAEGEITELHIGLKGTMSALVLRDLAQKTHRGLEGRILQGKSAGGNAYGYNVERHLTSDGTFTAGDRSINPEQAAVIREIFTAYASGRSPRAIAADLNRKGFAGPRGKSWATSMIYGNWRRGSSILNNELYIGKLVWNRQRFIKDPRTGRRQARPNPPQAVRTQAVEHLRIIDQELWDSVKGRQSVARAKIMEPGAPRPKRAQRPKHLLSGLLRCGACEAGYTVVGIDYYGCSAARNEGTCTNRHLVKRHELESRVLNGLRQNLLHPNPIAVFIEEYQRTYQATRHETQHTRQRLQFELGKTEAAIANIVEAIADGLKYESLRTKLEALEDHKLAIQDELATLADDQPVLLHPALSHLYRKKVTDLISALNMDELSRQEASEALRGLITSIRLTPDPSGQHIIGLEGDIAAIAMLHQEQNNTEDPVSVRMVAGVGFEPTTFRL